MLLQDLPQRAAGTGPLRVTGLVEYPLPEDELAPYGPWLVPPAQGLERQPVDRYESVHGPLQQRGHVTHVDAQTDQRIGHVQGKIREQLLHQGVCPEPALVSGPPVQWRDGDPGVLEGFQQRHLSKDVRVAAASDTRR